MLARSRTIDESKYMKYAKILASGGAVPDHVVTNADLEKMVDTSDQWITERTGIKQRYVSQQSKDALLDLTENAARQAITRAGIDVNEIGIIILATATPDQYMPSTACLLQDRLGIKEAIAFDLQAACSGFVYALTIAQKFMIAPNSPKYALVVGGEVLSKLTNWTDRNTCVLFGDGAGAVILEKSDEPGIIDCDLGSDGANREFLEVPWGIGQGYENIQDENRYIRMNGREVFKKSIPRFVNGITQIMQRNGLGWDDIDWIIPHQANMRIIEAVADKLKQPLDKFVATIARFGNTSSASIPLALNCFVEEGKIKRGQTIIMTGFGAGYTYGTVLFKY
jgi:3-oxoacyl-[acyl-carrier-protein] synthase-3